MPLEPCISSGSSERIRELLSKGRRPEALRSIGSCIIIRNMTSRFIEAILNLSNT